MTTEEHETVLQKAQRMQDQLVNYSTNGGFDGGDDAYRKLRGELLAVAGIDDLLPSFVKRHRDLGAYWQFIKREFKHYAERRDFLWEKFRPLLDQLEADEGHPAARPIEAALNSLDEEGVRAVWKKAMDRRIVNRRAILTRIGV